MNFLWFLTPTLLYVLLTYIRLNFLNIKSFLSSKDVMVKDNLLIQNNHSILYRMYTLIFFISILISQPYILYSNLFLYNMSINPNILSLLNLILLLIIFYISSSSSNQDSRCYTSLSLIFTLLTLLSLSITNLYQLYLVLELVAYTNLLLLVSQKQTTFNNSKQHLNATIISFMLNFLSSILFFIYIVSITWDNGCYSWNFIILFQDSTFQSIILTSAILIKLGVGPWLSGNYHAYAGYNLLYLVVYTLNFVIILTPVLIWLYLNSGYTLLAAISLISVILYISGTLHTVRSVKSLFAYSTVIIYFYLFLICLI